ncbi:polysaccharide biosynthesis protein [Candidatus Kaiserbacteria bacterium]|nr:polysaccharide biosynthesis protein [Candidatus Kaiserbacteria bacterium]
MKKNTFKNKTVVVTGGTGSVGSEIVRQLLRTNVRQVRIFSRDEHKQHELKHEIGGDKRVRFLIGDVRDKERMDFAFKGVDICFHAAALKHLPMCEYNPFEAVKTNIIGTQNVIEVAIRNNVEKVLAISTDKAADPASVLGASKLMMERLVTAANATVGKTRTRFASVRFGNVLNSRGSVVPIWHKQLEAGKNITVTDPSATRFLMEISDAAGLVFQALDVMRGGEIFVLKMKPAARIIDLAKEFLKKHPKGAKRKIDIIGLRPGEKLHEVLMTEDESGHAVEIKGMFVILPQSADPHSMPKLDYKKAKRAPRGAYKSN